MSPRSAPYVLPTFHAVSPPFVHSLFNARPSRYATFSTLEPESGINMRFTVDIDSVLVRLGKLHMHLPWGKNRIVYRDETACSVLDLALFDTLNLNTPLDDILLVRNEYVLAYEYILSNTLKKPPTRRRRSATLVTGQSGIGSSTHEFMTPETSADLAR